MPLFVLCCPSWLGTFVEIQCWRLMTRSHVDYASDVLGFGSITISCQIWTFWTSIF